MPVNTPKDPVQIIDEAIKEGIARAHSINNPKRPPDKTKTRKDETLPYLLKGLEKLEAMPFSKLNATINFKGQYTVISTNIPNVDNSSTLNIMVMEGGKYKTYFHDKEGAHATVESGGWDRTLSYIAEQAAAKNIVTVPKSPLAYVGKKTESYTGRG